jgi:hypothetical protein
VEVLADRPLRWQASSYRGQDLVGESGKLLHSQTIDGGSNAVIGGNA